MRHIVIGDVHGCLVEMVELLARLIPGSSDNVYFLGDLVDRGPHSAECIKLIIELQKSSQAGYHCVLGNHDEKYIRWFKHELNRELTGKANPMKFGEDKLATVEMLTSEDIAWLSKLPKRIDLPEMQTILVHAGLNPNHPVDEQHGKSLMFNRRFDELGKSVKYNPLDAAPEGTYHWSERWNGPQMVMYGHQPYMDGPNVKEHSIGLDTGCCFGGALTAYVMETQEFVSVKAKEEYRPR